MAVLLMREFQLITLRASLAGDATARGGSVRVQLEAFEGGRHGIEWGPEDLPLDAFGLPARLDPGQALGGDYRLQVPAPLVERVQAWMADHNPAGTPLWIYLVKPYGYLGLVPWERDIVEATGLPVLRLPDFLEPPLDTRSPLDVGVVCTVPPMVGKAAVRLPQLEEVVETLAGGLPRASQVHLFCDNASRDMARETFARLANVTVYEPPAGGGAGHEDAWFRWIQGAMGGTALDTVHFITHGVIGADGGMLALSAAPGSSRRGGFYPAAAEIDDFLAAVGAWGAAFHVPWDRSTDLGVRYVADSLGMIRPGTVLYHDGALDDDGDGLAGACALMYAVEPTPAPLSRAVFLYIQPARVLEAGGAMDVRTMTQAGSRRDRWDAELPAGYHEQLSGRSVPGYVLSVERMSEKWAAVLDGNEDTAAATPLGPSNALDVPYLSAAEQSAVDATISKLRSVVAGFALEDLAANLEDGEA